MALLIALYTVAAHESRTRALLAAGVLEAGAVMAALRWEPAGTPQRSLLFLTATVVAALFAGLTAASGSRYLAWMDERARRLEVERDQQAEIAAAAERTRIARELHDIVSHSLSVVITLADAAARGQPGRSRPRRRGDGRGLRGRPPAPWPTCGRCSACCGPTSRRARGPAAAARHRPSSARSWSGSGPPGWPVDLAVEGTAFPLGAAAELTAYRIVQEALTNTLRHASARHAAVTIIYDEPEVRVQVADDGTRGWHGQPGRHPAGPGSQGHGIDGMRERAALHGGALRAGPGPTAGGLAGRGHPPARAGARVSISVLAGRRPAAAAPRLPHDPGGRG